MITHDEVQIYIIPKMGTADNTHPLHNTDVKNYNDIKIFKDGYI